MNEASAMLEQLTLPDIPNAISSQASEAGPWRHGSQGGPMSVLSGLQAPHASRSVSPQLPLGGAEDKPMSATCCRSSSASSRSAALQLCLGSRLATRLSGDGLTKHSGEWRTSVTPAQRRYSQLCLSARDMNVSGSIGWPTPAARDGKDISRSGAFLAARKRHSPSMATLLLERGVLWMAITSIYCIAMGYPLAWNEARPKVTATQLSRQQRQSS